MSSDEIGKIVFKPKKRKNLRQRRNSDDEEESADTSEAR